MKEYKKKEKQQRAFSAMKGEQQSSKRDGSKRDETKRDRTTHDGVKRGENKHDGVKRGENKRDGVKRGENKHDGMKRGENKYDGMKRGENKRQGVKREKSYHEEIGLVEKKTITKGCLVCQECGQCSGQQVTYVEHVKGKQARLEEALKEYAKPLQMIKMDKPHHYKMRVHRLFHHERNGTPMSGYFSSEEGRVVKIDECHIDDKKCQEIINTIKGLLKSFKIKTYDVKSGHGLLRYVAVRRGVESKEIMVTLVLSSIIMPSKNNFVKELRRLHPEITTILISENYKNVESIYGDKEVNLYGKGFIWDSMCGNDFRISAKSQFTVNPVQMKKMCDTIAKWGEFSGEELLLDAYCGVGTFGITLSDKVRKIFSVETNNEMHRDTISNIRKNSIKNIDVYRNNPAEFVMQVANSEKERIDTVVVTQPYYGCGKEFIDAIGTAQPKKVFLVSRNLKSLQEEVGLLVRKGYRVKKSVGVDVYPWTERVDALVMLTR